MEEGSEQQRQQRPSSPEITAAGDALTATLSTKYGIARDSESGQIWQRLIDAAKNREFMTLDMQPSQLATALQQINRLLSAESWYHGTAVHQRLEIAEQLLTQIAFYPEPADGEHNPVLAIMQTLLYKLPGIVIRDAVDVLLNGRFVPEAMRTKGSTDAPNSVSVPWESLSDAFKVPSAYVQNLLYEVATSRGYKTRTGLDTPQLQNVYEELSGTAKGSFVLKNGSPFVTTEPEGSHKLFTHDTSYLNWVAKLDRKPLHGGSQDVGRGYAGWFSYRKILGPRGTTIGPDVDVTEDVLLCHERVIDRIRVKNDTRAPYQMNLTEAIDHPFLDMFEVRGWKRDKHGEQLAPLLDAVNGHARWSYKGLDGAIMSADIQVIGGKKPDSMTDNQMNWSAQLAPGETFETVFAVTPWMGDPAEIEPLTQTYAELDKEADANYEAWRSQQATISTGDKTFNRMIEQIYRDIYILREQTPRGPAIAAGLPWFACAFGRDDAITSLQTLPLMPGQSRDVLRTLAAYQGTIDNPQTAEKPGKIMHELRVGEMARNHEIPFAPYYGTVDATPLWLMLLGRYVEQTGDVALARELAPNIDRALQYLDAELARGNGYLTYGGVGREALSNQGWKDSGDSVFYMDGKLAQPPIALCEVQGYLYEGWRLLANVFRAEGDAKRAADLDKKANELQNRFQTDFWMPKRKFVAEALDGQRKPADIITSNPGQLLMTHILSPQQQKIVAARMMDIDMFSGFGIRTLGREQPRYFSNSYHNGSVWPHDNSLIACGLHEYSPQSAAHLMRSLFATAQHEDDLRLPELFGGYYRTACKVPVPYPVSCKPQAWADGAMLLMFASGAGLHIDGLNNTLTIDRALLPEELGTITLQCLHVGKNRVDLVLKPATPSWKVDVTSNPGNVSVVVR